MKIWVTQRAKNYNLCLGRGLVCASVVSYTEKMLPTEKRDQKQSVFEPEKQLRFENLLSQILDKNFIL